MDIAGRIRTTYNFGGRILWKKATLKTKAKLQYRVILIVHEYYRNTGSVSMELVELELEGVQWPASVLVVLNFWVQSVK
jgi:hypothetical protein